MPRRSGLLSAAEHCDAQERQNSQKVNNMEDGGNRLSHVRSVFTKKQQGGADHNTDQSAGYSQPLPRDQPTAGQFHQ